MYYLGIDFGTSFTKAAVFKVGTGHYYPVPLCDVGKERKDRSIPTVAYVSSDGQTITIGDDAINSKKNPGGKFYYNFKPEIDTLNEAPKDHRNIIGKIILRFFLYIKQRAEERFNQVFDQVVITIPASAPNGGLRYKLMKYCAESAGFKDVLIIPEPVAAAYFLLGDRVHSPEMDDKLFLIYDFGGGTFDASIIRVNDQQIHVIDESVGSDNELKWGGIYIDSLISMDYIKKSDYAKEQIAILKDRNTPFLKRLYASEHLRNEPIRVKIELSKKTRFNSPYSYSLSREDFELMIGGMVNITIESTLSLIDRAYKEKLCDDIHSVYQVFLVGGSSQIPLVLSRWQFHKNINQANFSVEVNPNLNIVALGAARYRDLRLSPQQLNAKGRNAALDGKYKKAAAYFNNAGDNEGLFNLGVLYYLGVIGRKRQPAKAYKLFEQSNFKEAFLMMALMSFNNDGVLKNDKVSINMLAAYSKHLPTTTLNGADTKGSCSKLFTSLHNVLKGGRDSKDLNTIYQFDAKSLFNN